MRLGPDFSSLGQKDIPCRAREKLNAGQNCFQTVIFFFTFFLQHVSLTLFHLCHHRF